MERKSIVKALESRFGCKAKYLGAPSFTYLLETEKGIFKVEKDGQIRTETGEIINLDTILAEQPETTNEAELWADREMHRMKLESDNIQDYSNRGQYGGDVIPANSDDLQMSEWRGFEIELPEEKNFSVSFPIMYHTPKSIRVMINMIASKQKLIMKSFGLTDRLLEDCFIEMINSSDISDMSEFESLINSTAPEDHKIVSFKFDEFALTFHLTKSECTQDEKDAFFDLITLIHEASLRQQYASEKSKEVVNEKYSFRVWLLRLGMIGDSYRVSRATLLKRLEGNSAFRQPKQPAEV